MLTGPAPDYLEEDGILDGDEPGKQKTGFAGGRGRGFCMNELLPEETLAGGGGVTDPIGGGAPSSTSGWTCGRCRNSAHSRRGGRPCGPAIFPAPIRDGRGVRSGAGVRRSVPPEPLPLPWRGMRYEGGRGSRALGASWFVNFAWSGHFLEDTGVSASAILARCEIASVHIRALHQPSPAFAATLAHGCVPRAGRSGSWRVARPSMSGLS